MPNLQQPDPSLPSVGEETGPVPEDNLAGHHPSDEQDKPDPADFVAKAKEVAARKKAPASKAPSSKAPSSKAPASKAPASTAPTAAVPASPADASETEADAPSATGPAVAAQLGSPPAATGAPTAGEGGTPSDPLAAALSLGWKVVTFPARTTLDVLGKLRKLL